MRFVWQMDADGRFVVGSDEFIELVGPRTTAAFGRLWSEIAAALKLDPDNQVARAVATHETWSGIVVSWPVDESDERLPVELSGCRCSIATATFAAIAVFGVCRDVARINQLARARRERPIGFMPPPEAADEVPLGGTGKPHGAAASRRISCAAKAPSPTAGAAEAAADGVPRRPRAPRRSGAGGRQCRAVSHRMPPEAEGAERSARSNARRSANWRRN